MPTRPVAVLLGTGTRRRVPNRASPCFESSPAACRPVAAARCPGAGQQRRPWTDTLPPCRRRSGSWPGGSSGGDQQEEELRTALVPDLFRELQAHPPGRHPTLPGRLIPPGDFLVSGRKLAVGLAGQAANRMAETGRTINFSASFPALQLLPAIGAPVGRRPAPFRILPNWGRRPARKSGISEEFRTRPQAFIRPCKLRGSCVSSYSSLLSARFGWGGRLGC
jgi:hypothetical protein